VSEQPTFELAGLETHRRGQLHDAVAVMVRQLDDDGRLGPAHMPMVALAYRLADALEVSGGRGASVAMLSAQFQDVWQRLTDLPLPVLDDDDTGYDVELIEAPVDDAS
jgi:hypothetical protein